MEKQGSFLGFYSLFPEEADNGIVLAESRRQCTRRPHWHPVHGNNRDQKRDQGQTEAKGERPEITRTSPDSEVQNLLVHFPDWTICRACTSGEELSRQNSVYRVCTAYLSFYLSNPFFLFATLFPAARALIYSVLCTPGWRAFCRRRAASFTG